jgi:hypothetical protein
LKSSLKINHTNTISATFEMAHKLQKNKNKNENIPAFTIKISAKNITFEPPSEVSKIAEGYIYFFESHVHMQVEGAWGMASCGREK